MIHRVQPVELLPEGFVAACQLLLSPAASLTASLTCTPTAVCNLYKPVTSGLNKAGRRLQVFWVFSVNQGRPCMLQTCNILINIFNITFESSNYMKWKRLLLMLESITSAVLLPEPFSQFYLIVLALLYVFFLGCCGDHNRAQRKVNTVCWVEIIC